jgi:FAD/FMN-containing dehydrogenase
VSSPTTPATQLLDDLRGLIGGAVVGPADPEFDTLRALKYGGLDRHPAAIARVVDADDVAAIVRYTAERGLPLSVRAGGHGVAGHAVVDDGIVIDLRSLKGLQIDPEGRTAWAEAGLTAGEFTIAAAEHGLGVGFGDTASVGLGGLALGGGVGYFVRKHGLTIDLLEGVELVTAAGELVTVDAEHNPELFWAARGGGGNFGVATGFRFRLVDVSAFTGGMLILPASPAILAGYIALSDAAPDELSSIVNVMPCPALPFVPTELHGQTVLFAVLGWLGDADTGRDAIEFLRSLATPIVDTVRPMPYPEIYPPENDAYRPKAVARTFFMDRFDVRRAEQALEWLSRSDATMRALQLRVLGGACAAVANDATAYAHRDRRIMGNVAVFWDTERERGEREAWATAFMNDLTDGDLAGYVNFLGDEGPERVRAAYPGETWDRLRSLKFRWDPDNLFRGNQNIPPIT